MVETEEIIISFSMAFSSAAIGIVVVMYYELRRIRSQNKELFEIIKLQASKEKDAEKIFKSLDSEIISTDIKKLVNFIQKMHELMIIFKKYRSILISEDELALNIYDKAWEQTESRFDDITKYLENEKPFIPLINAGLYGSALNLKITMFQNAVIEVENITKQTDSTLRKNWSEEDLDSFKHKLEKAMDYGDTILGSLGEAGIPGAGAIAEIKMVVEKIFKWDRIKKIFKFRRSNS